MECAICKGEMKERFVTYTEDVGESTVLIRHVPAFVCGECGNVWYSGKTAARLQKMVDDSLRGHAFDVAVEKFDTGVAMAVA
jgi:YgiT-type zinc finger domain-containing protein